ncbi:MAG: ATP-dependent DNA helicase [Methanobrevibacter sp.]|nr:ATP-dependent DNA helicase [Methanobrevibacter sp.]
MLIKELKAKSSVNSFNGINELNINKSKPKSEKNFPIPKEVIKNFPFEKPRDGQLEIITEIHNAIKKGYKFIILEAGTGTGKSVIGATLAKLYAPTFILTMTKQLQEQYLNDFKEDGFSLVKGRSNFNCLDKLEDIKNHKDSYRCDTGTCTERHKFPCKYGIINPVPEDKSFFSSSHAFGKSYWRNIAHCNYWQQKANGIYSNTAVMNYDYAMFEFNYPHDFKKRNLLILDEAHNIEKKIMGFIELKISKNTIEKDINVTIIDDEIKNIKKEGYNAWLSFINFIKRKYTKKIKKLKNKIEVGSKSPSNIIREKKLLDLTEELDRYQRFTKYLKQDKKNWILINEKESLYFKPIKIDNYTNDYLFKYADICIFMSATILDHRQFKKWLGINNKKVYSIKVDTPFKAKKHPINLNNTFNMKYNSLKKTAPKTLTPIEIILKNHENEKGLIHTISYQCNDYLMKNIASDRLITHKNKNRESILNKFEKSKKPLVLLSPSMNEGIDLPYDKCRFQIIYKLPFPNTADKQIDMRIKKDIYWYPYQTILNLVQSYGRGMRAEDDYCQTYIIDSRLKTYMEKSSIYRKLIPNFFKKAIIQ